MSFDEPVTPDFPNYFTIETVNSCNSRCIFCTISSWPARAPFMNGDLYNKIADEIIANRDQVQQVCLNGCGEPLLDRLIADRIKYLKNSGIRNVILTTNGSLLDATTAQALLEAGLDELLISFNGLDPEKYEELRVGLSFEKVLKNILGFIKLRDSIDSATRIRIRMEAHPIYSEEEICEWEDYWRNKLRPNDQVYAKKLHNWGNQLKGISEPSQSTNSPCRVLWSTVNILSDGTVALCCIDFEPRVPLGSLQEDTIRDVWHGNAFRQVRTTHGNGERDLIPLCRNCTVWADDQKINSDILKKDQR